MAARQTQKKARYPIRWISYKTRLEEDLERTFQSAYASDLFSSDYIKSLSDQVAQQDARIIKVQILAFTIYGYLALAYATPEASLSIFGIAIKHHPGVREVLLVLASSTIPLVLLFSASRDILIWTGEKTASLSTDPECLPFKRFILPASYGLRTYVGRQYVNYVFPTLATRMLHAVVGLLFLLMTFFMLIASMALTGSIVRQVWSDPMLGLWSHACIAYTLLAWALGLLWLIRFYFPLPYRDSSILLKLEELKDTDPQAHSQLLRQLFK